MTQTKKLGEICIPHFSSRIGKTSKNSNFFPFRIFHRLITKIFLPMQKFWMFFPILERNCVLKFFCQHLTFSSSRKVSGACAYLDVSNIKIVFIGARMRVDTIGITLLYWILPYSKWQYFCVKSRLLCGAKTRITQNLNNTNNLKQLFGRPI